MINTDIDKLTKLATAFRAAIIKSNPKSLPLITLQNYPYGACGDASLLLAKYLNEQGYSDLDYVCGEKKGHTHAWLDRHGLIIDITADQFEDQDIAVIITKDHTWHSSFNGILEKGKRFEDFDSYTVALFRVSYKKIKEYIKT